MGLFIHLFANQDSRGKWSRVGQAAPQCSLGGETQAPSLSLLFHHPEPVTASLKLHPWCGMAAEAPDITSPLWTSKGRKGDMDWLRQFNLLPFKKLSSLQLMSPWQEPYCMMTSGLKRRQKKNFSFLLFQLGVLASTIKKKKQNKNPESYK